jgi:hypothetical protein
MTITLPDDMREELERKAKAGGFGSIDEYLIWLCKSDDIDAGDLTAEDLGYSSEEELEAKLIASLDSGPPILATPELWAELRKGRSKRDEESP